MNAITLSFNGVDFRLVPDLHVSDAQAPPSNSKQIAIMPNGQNGKYQGIKLSSFTGTLFISPSPSASLSGEYITANTPMVPEERRELTLNAAVVDEEPASPLGKDTTLDDELPSGQTQLSFGKKKRKRSLGDTDERKNKRVSRSYTLAN